jgi:hypothetical protein
MNIKCTACGKEAKEGECFTMFLDPNNPDLIDAPQYCDECVKEIKSR